MDEFWEACGSENMKHLTFYHEIYEQTTYMPEVLEIMTATEQGEHWHQEDLLSVVQGG